jgi:hypothetical protein
MGWDFEVHIVVLALASEVFSVFLSGHFSESTGDKPVCLDVPQEILKAVLDFIYHGRTKVEHIYATQMLKFAHMYTMEALQLQITNQLCGCLDPEVAIDVMVECTALGLEVFLTRCSPKRVARTPRELRRIDHYPRQDAVAQRKKRRARSTAT